MAEPFPQEPEEPEEPALDRPAMVPEPVRPPPTDLGVEPSRIDLARLRATGGEPVVIIARLRWWVTLLVAAVFAGVLALGGFAVYHAVRDARDRPAAVAQPTATTAVDAASFTTVPTPATPADTLPGDVHSLFDPGAATALAPLLEQAIGAGAARFTSIIVYSDHAVTTTQDPTDPSRTVQTTWRPTGIAADAPKQEAIDFTKALFTVSDMDWSVIPGLVTAAPGLVGLPDHAVTDVVVQRWGFDPAFPMRVLVYVDGGKFVEALTNGQVVAVH
jgi:hypothetical protein